MEEETIHDLELINFSLVSDEKGIVFFDEDNVLLQNNTNGRVIAAPYSEVHAFYGLEPRVPGEACNAELTMDSSAAGSTSSNGLPSAETPKDASKPREFVDAMGYSLQVKWSEETTRFLMDCYAQYENQFKTKRLLYAHIAALIEKKYSFRVNWRQVECRYKCIYKKKTKYNEDTIYDDDDVSREDDVDVEAETSPGLKCRKSSAQLFGFADHSTAESSSKPSAGNLLQIKWSEECTRFMLETYAKCVNSVGAEFKTKRLLWCHIAEQIEKKYGFNVNFCQVESRYKCVLKRTKKPIYSDNLSKVAAVQEDTIYDDDDVPRDDDVDVEVETSPQPKYRKTDTLPSSCSLSPLIRVAESSSVPPRPCPTLTTPCKNGDTIGFSFQIKWPEESTRFLLQSYTKFKNSVGPLKKFKSKKLMWMHIAQLIEKKFALRVNWCQVQTRYKCVLKRTKKPKYDDIISGAVLEEEKTHNDDVNVFVHRDVPSCIEVGVSPGLIYRQTDTMPMNPPSSCSPSPPPPVEIPAHSIPESSSSAKKIPDSTGYTLHAKWTEEPTNFMLQKYDEFKDSVGPLKKFRNKKRMWAHIADLIQEKFAFNVNYIQVETRYKCVGKRAKNDAVHEQTIYDDNIDVSVWRDDPLSIEVGEKTERASPSPPNVKTPPMEELTIEELIPAHEIRRRKTPQMIMHDKWLAQKEYLYRRKEEKRMEAMRIRNEQIRLRNEQRTKYEEEKLQVFKNLAITLENQCLLLKNLNQNQTKN